MKAPNDRCRAYDPAARALSEEEIQLWREDQAEGARNAWSPGEPAVEEPRRATLLKDIKTWFWRTFG